MLPTSSNNLYYNLVDNQNANERIKGEVNDILENTIIRTAVIGMRHLLEFSNSQTQQRDSKLSDYCFKFDFNNIDLLKDNDDLARAIKQEINEILTDSRNSPGKFSEEELRDLNRRKQILDGDLNGQEVQAFVEGIRGEISSSYADKGQFIHDLVTRMVNERAVELNLIHQCNCSLQFFKINIEYSPLQNPCYLKKLSLTLS